MAHVNGSIAAQPPGPVLMRTIMKEIRCGGLRHSKIANPKINYGKYARHIGPFARRSNIKANGFGNEPRPGAYRVNGTALIAVPESEIQKSREMLIVATEKEAQNGLLRNKDVFEHRKFYSAVITFERKAVVAQAPKWLSWLGGIAYQKSKFLKELCSALDRLEGLGKGDVKPLDQMGQAYYSISGGSTYLPRETVWACDKSWGIPKDAQISVIFDKFWKMKNKVVSDFYLVLAMGPVGGDVVSGKAKRSNHGLDAEFGGVLKEMFVHLEGIASSVHKGAAHQLLLAIEGRKEPMQKMPEAPAG